MDIWVDADACPVVIKEILFRAAKRTGIQLTLVANQSLSIPKNSSIRMIQVPSGFDVADNEIARLNMRDFMDTLRASGINTGGPAAINQSDIRLFANHLDTLLTRAQ